VKENTHGEEKKNQKGQKIEGDRKKKTFAGESILLGGSGGDSRWERK
jgi:hypothetical protein